MRADPLVLEYIASNMEQYMSVHQVLVIIDGGSEEKYKAGMKKLEKVFEKFHEGKGKKYLNDKCYKLLENSLRYEAEEWSKINRGGNQ